METNNIETNTIKIINLPTKQTNLKSEIISKTKKVVLNRANQKKFAKVLGVTCAVGVTTYFGFKINTRLTKFCTSIGLRSGFCIFPDIKVFNYAARETVKSAIKSVKSINRFINTPILISKLPSSDIMIPAYKTLDINNLSNFL